MPSSDIICSKCGQPGEWDICPYAQDVEGKEEICDCCDDCRTECAADI